MIKTGAYTGEPCTLCGSEETLKLPNGKNKCLNSECARVT